MRYDFSNDNTETKNLNFLELEVSEIEYSFLNKKAGGMDTRKVCLIAKNEKDALQLIGSYLPAGTKFSISTYQSDKARIQAISPVMKRIMYDALKKEFASETKKGLFTSKKGKK